MQTTAAPITNPALMWVDAATAKTADVRIVAQEPRGLVSANAQLTEAGATQTKEGWMLLNLAGDTNGPAKFSAFTDAVAAAQIASRTPIADVKDIDANAGDIYLVDQGETPRAWLLSSATSPATPQAQTAIDAAADLDSYVRENGFHLSG